MAYTEITSYDSPNFTASGQTLTNFGYRRSIEGITIHWWDDPKSNPAFEEVVSGFCRPGGLSAHAVVTGTGRRVAWLVNTADTAWHAGNAKGNATTVGIECDPRARNEDYDVAAELIADIWIAENRKLPLYPHNKWIATRCPGTYDLTRLNQEARQWYERKTDSVLRDIKQQGETMLNEGDVINIYRITDKREPAEDEKKAYAGKAFKKLVYEQVLPKFEQLKEDRDTVRRRLDTIAQKAGVDNPDDFEKLLSAIGKKEALYSNYNKFWVALAGAVVTILAGQLGGSNQIVQAVIALLTALGVYSAPNKTKTR